jgi:hypothetical protein
VKFADNMKIREDWIETPISLVVYPCNRVS